MQKLQILDMDAHPPLGVVNTDYMGELDSAIFFSRLSHAGIHMACGSLVSLPGFFETHGVEEAICRLNQGAMELAASEPRYIPALRVHPDCPELSLAQLKKYVRLGIRVLEVDADWLTRPEMSDLFAFAAAHGMTASLRGKRLEQVEAVAENFPSLRLLVGGVSASGVMPGDAFRLLERFSQIYINLSGAVWSWNYVMHEWCSRLPVERLVFGTGYPACNPGAKVAAAVWELRDQPDEVKRKIFEGNGGGILWK